MCDCCPKCSQPLTGCLCETLRIEKYRILSTKFNVSANGTQEVKFFAIDNAKLYDAIEDLMTTVNELREELDQLKRGKK